jgi:hypothetical protein
MKAEAKKLFRKAKKKGAILSNPNRIHEALDLLDQALLIDPDAYEIWHEQGLYYLQANQRTKAIIAFQHALIIKPTNLQSAEELNQLFLSQGKSVEELGALPQPDIRSSICRPDYLSGYEQLVNKNKDISKLSFPQQIEWITKVIQFIRTYYDYSKDPYPFINPAFVSQTAEAQKLRIEQIGSKLPYVPVMQMDAFNSNYTPFHLWNELCLNTISYSAHDIFLDEAKVILRMIFETIHQFPREMRAQLVNHLPWGENSWYLLEYCGSLFIPDSNLISEAQYGGVTFPSGVFKDQVRDWHLNSFYEAIRNFTCLVKIVMVEIIEKDLDILEKFFSALNTHLQSSSDLNQFPRVHKIHSLPVLRVLLWHAKHSFNLMRLVALLPNKHQSKTIFVAENPEFLNASKFTPLTLMHMQNRKSGDFHTIKSRLSSIMRMSLAAEILTKRGWGSSIDAFAYIDINKTLGIRNGFTHIEDLADASIIYQLEGDVDLLTLLQQEYGTFKKEILYFISLLQSRLLPWPDLSLGIKDNEKALWAYWDSVKKEHHDPDSASTQPYIPLVSLVVGTDILEAPDYDLPDNEMKFLFSGIKNIQSNDEQEKVNHFKSVIKGTAPFDDRMDYEKIRLLLSDDFINDKKSKNRFKSLLKRAEKKYRELKKDHDKTQLTGLKKTNLKRTEIKNAIIRHHMSKYYPFIDKIGGEFNESLANNAEISPGDLLKRLQNRVILLKDLLEESNIKINLNNDYSAYFYEVFDQDIELQLSCFYLINQIISIMNKLDSLGLLQSIDFYLAKNMTRFVALRNAIEHSDPITDSKVVSSYQMLSETTKAATGFIEELILGYEQIILLFKSEYFGAIQKAGERMKQDKPLDVSEFDGALIRQRVRSLSAPDTYGDSNGPSSSTIPGLLPQLGIFSTTGEGKVTPIEESSFEDMEDESKTESSHSSNDLK